MTEEMGVDAHRKAGSRLREDMDPVLRQELYPGPWESVRHDLSAIHRFDKAHCVMLVEERIIPRDIGGQLLTGLRELEREGVLEARRSVGASHHSGELWLTRRYGEQIAGWLHVGRSSGDLGAVAASITARGKLLPVWDAVLTLRGTLLTLAGQHVETVMPGYSGAQHAQPITFGFFLHSWEEAFRRDTERLEQAYRRINRSPAGAAIMTGSDFPLNRPRVSELLGFEALRTNCHDAIFHWDHLGELACALTLLMTNAGRLANDLHVWTTSEFGLVDLPDRYCVTSSIMPQKKNPWSTVFVRGQYARSMGRLAAILALMKTPQDEFEPHVFVPWELWDMVEGTLRSLEFLDGTLKHLHVNRELMAQRAAAHWATASDLASALVRERRLPWRTAHHIVAIVVRLALERGVRPQDVTPALVDEAATAYTGEPVELEAGTLRKAVDPVHFVSARTLIGGPAPEALAAQLTDARRVLQQDRRTLQVTNERLDQANRLLEDAIDRALA